MIPKLDIPAILSAVLLLGASVLRIVYYTGVQATAGEIWLQEVLPVFAGLWLLLMIFTSTADRLHRTFLPVLLGLVSFAVKAAAFPAVHRYLCWALYAALAVVYYLMVTKALTKWLFMAMMLAMLCYLCVEDLGQQLYLELYTNPLAAGRAPQWHLLVEISVLLTILALFSLTSAMVRRETDGWVPGWGDRNDGRRLRSITPIYAVSPYIMVERNTASNLLRDTMECSKLDMYIRRKRLEGLSGFGLMHVVLAAYARCAAQYPGVNRFLSGQRIYSRGDELEIALTVKPEMSTKSTETVIKIYLAPTDTAEDVHRKIQEQVDAIKTASPSDQTSFDLLAAAFDFIPGLLLKSTVWLLKLLDYFGLLPRALTRLSPFHGSLFITSMASLGIPPIYHHLYDFGNIPIFVSLGKKYRRREVDKDGKVLIRRYVDYTFVTDERIVDGFYYAAVLRCFRGILQDPDQLDMPAATVVRDVD